MTRARRQASKWAVWSTVQEGVLMIPRPVSRLPKIAEISGDGRWATCYGSDGRPVSVFVRLDPEYSDAVRQRR